MLGYTLMLLMIAFMALIVIFGGLVGGLAIAAKIVLFILIALLVGSLIFARRGPALRRLDE
ncbi:DUF1328 domain-containing protein [Candidatus Parcubacteria bacterium]|nr:DUF1328 domain-containing protein [Candidatus Parcubacteria bacterium]